MKQPDLFAPAPARVVLDGPALRVVQSFDGETFESARDGARLTAQLDRVRLVVQDGRWRSLSQIAQESQAPVASVSARLRDLRKDRFGGYSVERRYVVNGLYEYRLEAKR